MHCFVVCRIEYIRYNTRGGVPGEVSSCSRPDIQFSFLFVSHLRSMGLNVLGYYDQSHLLQRCHPACGH